MTRVTYMGEEVSLDDLGDATVPVENEDYFKDVALSRRAIDEASKIVPKEHWEKVGLYTWLHGRANRLFRVMPASETKGRIGKLGYTFEYSADGPVLKTVELIEE